MKINWKVRFRNKVFLYSMISLVVSFAFDLLAMFDVFPAISENMVLQLASIVLTILSGVGIVTDPTTEGVGDSERALSYSEPYAGENG